MSNSILTQGALIFIAFFMGNVSGFVLHDLLKRSFNMTEQTSKNFLLVIVSLIWACSMLVDLISPSYDVPVAVHALMGAIVGFFFYRPKEEKK